MPDVLPEGGTHGHGQRLTRGTEKPAQPHPGELCGRLPSRPQQERGLRPERKDEETTWPPIPRSTSSLVNLARALEAAATKQPNKRKPKEQPERSRHLGRLPGGDATELELGQVAGAPATQEGIPLQIST